MNCVICRTGSTEAATTTLALQRAGATVVVRDVPAQVCTTCGEAYVDEDATAKLLERATDLPHGAELEVRRYVAA